MEISLLEISTSRLLLKPISMAYKEDIFREFTAEITTYLRSCPHESIYETKSLISEALADILIGNDAILVILKKDNQEFLGCTGIHELNSRQPELGIWLKKSAHGNGYGLEAIIGVKKWIEENLDYEYIVYPVDKANMPSRRIPERLGGKVFREWDETNLSGKILHLIEYRIPKS
jgi:[ribosomal protein S5]-alanine N-acetyltransferase